MNDVVNVFLESSLGFLICTNYNVQYLRDMQPYAMGVDIGTGSTKAIAITLAGNVLANTQKHYPTISAKKGYAEQDPELIFKSFISCINEAIKKTGSPPLVIGLSSCMHSLVCVNKNHQPVSSLITWADNRAAFIAEEFRRTTKGKKIYAISGAPVHAMLPLCKIIWLQKNSPTVFEQTEKFISIKEFIWYKLFNDYQVDESIASATGLFNTAKRQWAESLIRLCNISPHQLSTIVSTNFLRRYIKTNSLLQISNETAFCIGASDGCLANLGVNALKTSIAALTIGTSGAVRIASPHPIYDSKTMLFNYILNDTTFIIGGPVNNGGNIIQWLFKTFLQIGNPSDNDYHKLFTVLKAVPPACNGLVFLPYIHGERCPVWDENSSGIFMGIKSHHTTSHFIRAGIEGVCYALKNIIKIIELHKIINQVNVSGGFIISPEWLQILTNILNKKVSVIADQDASARGAAIMGLQAIGKLEGNELPSEKYTILKPDKKIAAVYEKQYFVYRQLYNINKKNMHVLIF